MLPRTLAIASLRQTSRLRRHTGTKRVEKLGSRTIDDVFTASDASREGPPRPPGQPPGGQRAKRAWGDVHPSREGPPRPTGRPPGGQRTKRAWGDVSSIAQLAAGQLDEEVFEIRGPMQIAYARVRREV